MNEVEEALRRTFGQAAEQAPRLPGMLPQRLERIHLGRRRRARMALAAAAVVLISGGSLVVLRGGDTTTIRQGEAASQSRATTPSEHVEKVWPEAVRKLPGKGPDGAAWRPATFIDDRTLLMTESAGSGITSALYAYDFETAAQRKIADVPKPAGTVSFASDFTVGGGHVVWWTATKDSIAHLWAMPLEGGEAKIVADQSIEPRDGSGVDGIAVVNDKIVFSLYSGGVFTVPLGGGTVEPVEESAGMHLLAWPWIGTPGMGGESAGAPVNASTAEKAWYERIRNVETGETRTAIAHPGEELRACGVSICVGRTSEGESFFRQRDGSQEKRMSGRPFTPGPPTQDRFYISVYGAKTLAGVGLYDLVSGESGDLGIQPKGSSITLPGLEQTGRILSYWVGDDLYIIDLSKIQ